jgi:hypothetical protein
MKKNKGYIASSIVMTVSTLLLFTLVPRSVLLYQLRMNMLDAQNKAQSREAAEMCLVLAHTMLLEERSLSINTERAQVIKGEECSIVSIQNNVDLILVRTSAVSHQMGTYLEAEMSKGTLSVISKTEYGHF